MSERAPTATPDPTGRWELIRDVAVFQLKLGLDALRDLVWSPLSLGAAAIDLIFPRPGTQGAFHGVMRLGRRSERAINLFGEGHGGHGPEGAEPAAVDAAVERLERLLVEQVERGGVTATAKAAIDRALDALGRGRAD